MPSKFRACAGLTFLLTAATGNVPLCAQNAFSPGGPEYPVVAPRVGDQTAPHAALAANGGWMVWQDNGIDGAGLGVAATKLGNDLNGAGPVIRVNQQGAGDQEHPRVALLQNGGAIAVWQGGQFGFQKIFARVIAPNGAPSGSDVLVNTYTNFHQVSPAVATLQDGSVIVVWSSFNQDGSLLGVYGQRLSATGAKLNSEFKINQFSGNNQRTPAVAALAGGGFVVAWVSELQRGASSVDIYVRRFDASGNPLGSEFAANTNTVKTCANPSVAASPDGAFLVAWSENSRPTRNAVSGETFNITASDESQAPNGWDVFTRLYSPAGAALGGPVRLNTWSYGDQYAPQVSVFGQSFLVAWMSLAQDGSREGIFAQFLNRNGGIDGVEFRVNERTVSRQIHPAIVSDGANRFLAAWATFNAGTSFDLVARVFDLIRTQVKVTPQGLELSWNSQPGSVYRVQSSGNLSEWNNHGGERTAVALTDSIVIPATAELSHYRVIRVR